MPSISGLVVLVGDLADDLLERVFDRHDARNAAVFVEHHGDVVAAPLKLLQQIVDGLRLGHEERLAQKLRPAARGSLVRLGQFGEQVLRVQDADDVVGARL